MAKDMDSLTQEIVDAIESNPSLTNALGGLVVDSESGSSYDPGF